jgi:hypothetical protein
MKHVIFISFIFYIGCTANNIDCVLLCQFPYPGFVGISFEALYVPLQQYTANRLLTLFPPALYFFFFFLPRWIPVSLHVVF